MGTVTLGAEDLFPQSQITPRFGNQLLYEAVIRTTITPNDITVVTILFHGIDPISGFVAGFYSLDTLYTREINGIPQGTGVRVPLTGQINPLGLNEAPPVAFDYNVIQILGGSGTGTTATGQQVVLNILPFTVFSREETIVLP